MARTSPEGNPLDLREKLATSTIADGSLLPRSSSWSSPKNLVERSPELRLEPTAPSRELLRLFARLARSNFRSEVNPFPGGSAPFHAPTARRSGGGDGSTPPRSAFECRSMTPLRAEHSGASSNALRPHASRASNEAHAPKRRENLRAQRRTKLMRRNDTRSPRTATEKVKPRSFPSGAS